MRYAGEGRSPSCPPKPAGQLAGCRRGSTQAASLPRATATAPPGFRATGGIESDVNGQERAENSGVTRRPAASACEGAAMTEHDGPATLCEAFQATVARYPQQVALRTPGGAVTLTWQQYAGRVRDIAAGLAGLGVGHGDTVALMMTNRPEFHLVDTAAFHLGAVPFSIYNTFAPGQITQVLSNAACRVAVCEEQFAARLLAARDGTAVEHMVCVDANPEGTLTLGEVEAGGDPAFGFEACWRAVRQDDVLTLIYTSGTTGPPKGVEITHAQMLAELEATTGIVPITPADVVISYLPDAHIANRWGAHYNSLVTGMQVVTLADLKQLINVLPQVRPTFFGAVPQVWYK